MKHNFEKLLSQTDLGTGYDFKSIMHYPDNAFQITQSPTIEPLDKKNEIKPSSVLTKIDIEEIRALYNCTEKSKDNLICLNTHTLLKIIILKSLK